MVNIDEEASSSEEQIIDESNQILKEYLDNIDYQLSTINRKGIEENYFKELIINFFKQESLDNIFDRSILIDPSFTEYDKSALTLFQTKMNEYFEKGFGLSFSEGNICVYYYLYDILVLNFVLYFVTYLNGLQKLDYTFEEDIPNYKELSFTSFCAKKEIPPDDSNKIIVLVREYIDYILSEGIIPEQFFEVCLLESDGNIGLLELVVESSNLRINYDPEFFILKIEKILSSEEIRGSIEHKFLETIHSINSEGVL